MADNTFLPERRCRYMSVSCINCINDSGIAPLFAVICNMAARGLMMLVCLMI